MYKKIDVKSRDNNFYLVRLILASRVIFGHAFALAITATTSSNPFARVYTSMGVNGFFIVSGFLVTMSLMSSKSITDYALARILRIVPALWVMLLITVPLVLLFGADSNSVDQNTLVSAAEYLVRNMAILPVDYHIAGVFEDMPSHAVNGSIWSLRFEVMCYVVLGILAALRLIRWRWLIAVGALGLIIAFMIVGSSDSDNFFLVRIVRTHSLFFFGCALALFADRIHVSVLLGLISTFTGLVIGYYTNIYELTFFAFGYLIISLAYSDAPILRAASQLISLKRFGSPDLSYGVFLYSFPIQQILYRNEITTNPFSNIAMTVLLAGGCAFMSSQLVEKPTSRLRGPILTRLSAKWPKLP